jgi:hypothetical protein
MDNDQLIQTILVLLKSGIQITIEPITTPFGNLFASVRFTPPATQRTTREEIAAFLAHQPFTLPGETTIDLFYHPEQLQKAIQDAAILYLDSSPGKPT